MGVLVGRLEVTAAAQRAHAATSDAKHPALTRMRDLAREEQLTLMTDPHPALSLEGEGWSGASWSNCTLSKPDRR
jgi:hypothetical protein